MIIVLIVLKIKIKTIYIFFWRKLERQATSIYAFYFICTNDKSAKKCSEKNCKEPKIPIDLGN